MSQDQVKIEIHEDDPFEVGRKNFEKLGLAKKLSKKYKPVPYEEANKELYTSAKYGMYFFSFISIVTASTFVFSKILSNISNLPFPFFISIILTAFILVIIERIQCKKAPDMYKQLLWKGFSKKVAWSGLFLLLLSGCSLFFSYSGGFDFAEKASSKEPVFVTPSEKSPVLVSLDEITKRYNNQISPIKEAYNEAVKNHTADSWEARTQLNKLKPLQESMNAEIKAAKVSNEKERANILAENNRRLSVAKSEHEQLLIDRKTSIENNGGGLSTVAIIAFLLFHLCAWYQENYEFETAKQYASVVFGNGNGNGNKRQNPTTTGG